MKDSGDDWSPSSADESQQSENADRNTYQVEFEPESDETVTTLNSSPSTVNVCEWRHSEQIQIKLFLGHFY